MSSGPEGQTALADLSLRSVLGVLDSTNEGVIIQDASGRIVYANAAAAMVCGLPWAGPCSQGATAALDSTVQVMDESGASLCEAWPSGHRVLRGEHVPEATLRLRRMDTGQERWVHARTLPIADSVGQLSLAATLLADITQEKKSEEELSRKTASERGLARENEVLAEIGRIISSSLDIPKVYQAFAEQVNKLIPFDRIAIGIADAQESTACIAYEAGLGKPAPSEPAIIPLEGTVTQEVMRRRSGIILDNTDDPAILQRFPGFACRYDPLFKTAVSVPLIADGQPVGAMHLKSTRRNAYTPRDLVAAERIGLYIGGALANSRLHAQVRREVFERETLARIGRIISSSLDISTVYERFAQQVQKLIPFDRITIALVDYARNLLVNTYVSGLRVTGLEVGCEFPIVDTPARAIVHKRARLLEGAESVEDFLKRYPSLASSVAAGLRSLLAVPLVFNGQVIATMTLRSTRTNAYSQADLALAERIANQIAGAIANSQLYATCQRQMQVRETLASIGRIINSSLELEEVYQRFAEQVHKLVSFDRITVALVDMEQHAYTMTYVTGKDVPERRRGDRLPMEGTLTAAVVSGGPGIVLNASSYEEVASRFPGLAPCWNEGLRSFLSVPLVSKGKPVGVLQVHSSEVNAYTEADLELVEQIGAQIAGALANAQLYAELKSAEESLRRSEAINRAMLNAIPDLIMRIRRDGTYLDCKQARDFETFVPPDQFIGKKAHDIMPSEVSSLHMQHVEQSLRTNTIQVYEYPLALASGTREFEARATACGQDEALVIVRDITERKRMEESLLRRTQQLEALMAVADILASSGDFRDKTARVLDELSRVAQADRVVLRLYDDRSQTLQLVGWVGAEGQRPPPVQTLKRSFYHLAYEQGQTVVANDYPSHPLAHPSLVSQGIKSMVSLPIRAEGRVRGVATLSSCRPGHFTPELVRFLEGIADGMCVLLENARLQQELQAQLEYDERQLDAFRKAIEGFSFNDTPAFTVHRMVHLARDIVMANYCSLALWNAEGKITHFEVSGVPPQEAQRIADVCRSAGIPMEFQHGKARSLRLADISTRPELWALLPDDPRMKSFLSATMSVGGVPCGAFYLAGKVGAPEFSADDERLLNFYSTLAGMQLELQKQNETRLQFLSVLAHELRTPLAPLMTAAGALERLLRPRPGSTEGQLLASILTGAEALRDCINDLLDIAAFQAGRFSLRLRRFDAGKAIAQTCQFLAPQGMKKAQQVILEVPETLPRLRADRHRFQQMLSNLLVNAMKFSPEGSPITVRAWKQKDALVVQVEDRGPGISRKEQARLFQPYFRTEQDRHRFHGLGLGLALSRQIAEAHGGRIWVDSDEGKGSRFSFLLPLEPAVTYTMPYQASHKN